MNGLLPAFDFTAIIATSGHSAVYHARQRSLERDVAVKILSPHVSGSPAFRETFESTARSMAQLNHPNLIGVYDSGCVEDMLYFVMEFVPGKSLERSANGQQVELQQSLRLLHGICAGLAHAHGHGIAHGNLTLGNILLNQKAEPKISNFGFSRSSGDGPHAATPFNAPELLAGNRMATPAADIHSIGAIAYQLLTGLPHSPDAAPPSTLVKCGARLDAVWQQATHADPGSRFSSVAALQAALTEAASGPRAPITAAIPASQRLARNSPPSPALVSNPAPPPSPKARQSKVGFNWILARNLLIIVGLLYAISLAWDNLKASRAKRDQENRETIARQEAKRAQVIEDARQRAAELAAKAAAANAGTPKPGTETPATPAEDPMESLDRLRDALATGARTEMPIGSISRGDCHYLLVPEPMSWPDASWFAEQHGAHLAIPDSTADLPWMVENLVKDQPVWIGAARNGRNTWALADGKSWQPKKEPSGIGDYLAVDPHGFLRTEGAKVLRPFILQWRGDGTNPGALTELLAITRKSLTGSTQFYPPGTRNFGVRHFLYVARPLAWREAVDMAARSGGHLAVATQISETVNLDDLVRDVAAPDGIWLGAFLRDAKWQWITGEPWKTAKWAKGRDAATADAALILDPGKGWDSRPLSDPASGFIIEWSQDHKGSTAAATPGGSTATATDAGALTARAKELIQAADSKRTEKLANNVKKLSWDLDVYLRGLNKSNQGVWSHNVQMLKKSVRDNRVPSAIPRSSGIQLSAEMAKMAKAHSDKQDQIDAEFAAEAEKIRSAFIAKLRDARTQAQQSAQPALVKSLDQSIQEASSLKRWIKSFGVELQPKNPVPKTQTNPNSNGTPRYNTNGGWTRPVPQRGDDGILVE